MKFGKCQPKFQLQRRFPGDCQTLFNKEAEAVPFSFKYPCLKTFRLGVLDFEDLAWTEPPGFDRMPGLFSFKLCFQAAFKQAFKEKKGHAPLRKIRRGLCRRCSVVFELQLVFLEVDAHLPPVLKLAEEHFVRNCSFDFLLNGTCHRSCSE